MIDSHVKSDATSRRKRRATLRTRARARVSALGALLALYGCGDTGGGSTAAPPPKSRFEAVAAKTPSGDTLAGFCDVRAEPGQGKPFRFPALEGGAAAPAQQGVRWVNVWATWCKPCVEEMPMISTWQKQLATEGKRLDVQFVSVDESAELVQAFRAQHPALPPSFRLADPTALAAFVAELGLDSGAGLPIHVFLEPDARIRCVRAGAITESHYAIVSSLM
jgi:thiol-disulfide isomerase/thioredoxin